jgi:DNA-binding transcriptional MerR regulator
LTRPLGPPCTPGILVSELAKRTGTTRKALRLYEAAALIAPDGRTEGGYRLYGAEVVPAVSFILKARRAGFTVAEIRGIVRLRAPAALLATTSEL